MINPLLAEGQVIGAAVQAVGECLYEQVGYDDDGQPLAVNLYDYHLPTAQSAPTIVSALRETSSPWNPLGAKGVGEGGSIGRRRLWRTPSPMRSGRSASVTSTCRSPPRVCGRQSIRPTTARCSS